MIELSDIKTRIERELSYKGDEDLRPETVLEILHALVAYLIDIEGEPT